MRPNDIMTRQRWGAGSTDSSEDCSSLDDDPLIVSVHLLTEPESTSSVRKHYQGMVDMLDSDLQVICVSDKNEIREIAGKFSKIPSSDVEIPCLATVLFFNGDQQHHQTTKHRKTAAHRLNGFSKPDLLLNHMWNGRSDVFNVERDFGNMLDVKGNDVTHGRHTPFIICEDQKWDNNNRKVPSSNVTSPFLRYDEILKESEENEQSHIELREKDIGFRKQIFDFEMAETALEARKQLETWPWEFHHKANVSKGITQCQTNSQDFYEYQPDRDVTRLYGDVIDTSKISRRRNLMGAYNDADTFVNLVEETTDELRERSRGRKKKQITTTDFPLMAVREVHYGKQHLRYTLFVSSASWIDQVEFYRLLLRRHEVTLRDDFCFFTIYYGENTDIQFALKRLAPNQRPVPLGSSILQFKVHKVGHLVPLLPHACKPISDIRWQTKDHDGNSLLLQICHVPSVSDTSSSQCEREIHPLDDAVASPSEVKHSSDEDNEFSLERLDSFIEPELPARMPLLTPTLYTNPTGRSRFGSRTTSSLSPGSSSSNSPERRPRRFGAYTPRVFSGSSYESAFGSTNTLPNPRHTSKSGSSSWTSRISESSDEPENTNFYRRAKFKKDVRRKSDGTLQPRQKSRPKSSSRTPNHNKQYSNNHRYRSSSKNRKSQDAVEEEVEVYV
ncbi:uncharacterized protein LOC120327571 [Styela clava]